MEEELWTERDGTKIAVGDMDVGHLRNTLRMIIRNNRQNHEYIPPMYDSVECVPTMEELKDKYGK